MKIIRYEDSKGYIQYAETRSDGLHYRLDGALYGTLLATGEKAEVARLLAPLEPAAILCIGLNYRHHAAESGAKIPERPILFVKGNNTLQHPGSPIVLPTHLASHEVDYECE